MCVELNKCFSPLLSFWYEGERERERVLKEFAPLSWLIEWIQAYNEESELSVPILFHFIISNNGQSYFTCVFYDFASSFYSFIKCYITTQATAQMIDRAGLTESPKRSSQDQTLYFAVDLRDSVIYFSLLYQTNLASGD